MHMFSLSIPLSLRREEWYSPWIFGNITTAMLRKEGTATIEELGRAPLPTEFGDWTYIVFGDLAHGKQHEVLVFGDASKDMLYEEADDILVRVHSSCRTSEIFHAVNCECREQLHSSMSFIRQEGRGVIVYLDQEGRGNGIVGKLAQLNKMFGWKSQEIEQKQDISSGEPMNTVKAYKESGYLPEVRDFNVAGEILKILGVRSVKLLTNNPQKIEGIASVGIGVKPVEIHITPANEIIAIDLQSKARNLKHKISEEHWKTNKS
ncbi:MAG: hypothetical protein A3C27_02540 [Candidatus Levybacteria bacterium RIFCSPHIGHO2_02_FULL_39_36]|nr:MAG: hypothetical protein A3E68_02090 [Candidatus Levybacteria bacterium RIFCSPHIGHO2_12_FULL_39_39]OGH28770.1 MAG: hypothetical protein A3C27_02540 [Candidatus Levybacteria bacterium RIFCSPHIGHO2_02_FULL_39_36]OGH35950.1 MAG: hypothetical protein A3B43_02815 [Candidatus Levybacteria bacterium RIFCSPLOWO2_01_FULL_38_120]OGH47447.1 MAG: hypothetical protein A3G66_02570 [Candidatus Levybacteria bacterium RIFCSPLOWO2_12_FULL_39_17]